MQKRVGVSVVTKEADDKQCSVKCNFCTGRLITNKNVVCYIFWVDGEDELGENEIEYKQCEHMHDYGECDNGCKQLTDNDVINRHPNCIASELTLE